MQTVNNFVTTGLREIKATKVGSIQGSVLELSNPLKSPSSVRCYNRTSGLLECEIRNVKSSYTFHGLNALGTYTIFAIDSLRRYNAVIQDMVAPK
jgi:hypothetical protein